MRGRSLSLALWSLALTGAWASGAAIPVDTTHVLEVGEGWEYAAASGPPSLDALPESWQETELPHTQGIEANGLYRVRFAVPAVWHRERVVLVVRSRGGTLRAWVNGKAAGVRAASAADARFDVSDAVRRGGDNTLLVGVSTPGWSRRSTLDACWLEANGAVAVDRLAASAQLLSTGALVDVRLAVRNRGLERFDGHLDLSLEPAVQAKGKAAVWRRHNGLRIEPGQTAVIHHAYEIEQPRLWRFDAPSLYRLKAAVTTRQREAVHTAERRLGLRTVGVADGRWLVNGQWVRLAGISVRASGATLLCTQPGQASAVTERLAPGQAATLPDLLDLCDREGIVVWLDAPAREQGTEGIGEALDALAGLARHPCVWGWVVHGKPEAYLATAARVRELTPRLPVGRPLPEVPDEAADFDFVLQRIATRAIRHDNNTYGRRLDDARRDAGDKAIAILDAIEPAAPGDRASVAGSIPKRRGEAARRSPISMLFFELPADAELARLVEAKLCAFSLKPPRHQARLDAKTKAFAIKTSFEATIASPVAARMPCHSLAGCRVVWRATLDGKAVGEGSIPLATLRPRSIEGRAPAPVRGEAEWRLAKAGTAGFAVELQSAAGRVVASHRASVAVAAPKGKVKLTVGPPKAEPAPAPPPRAFARPEQVVMLDLAKLFDNDGISSQANKKDGNFDLPKLASGSSYPADLLPKGGAAAGNAAVPGLKFRFPDKADGTPNNVRCDGQRLDVPAGTYSKLWLLASADNAHQEGVVRLVYGKGEEPVTIRVSDWCSEAKFGEIEFIRCAERHTWDAQREKKACRIWAVAVAVRGEPLKAVVLPKRTSIHLFAATLVRALETQVLHVGGLSRSFNNDGISWRSNRRDGNFDLPGRRQGDSFAADLLPKGGAHVPVPGDPSVTFLFPSKDDRRRNNVVCDGQRVAMPEPVAAYDAAWFLGAAHDGDKMALLTLEYADGKAQGELRLADWCGKPTRGEIDVLRMPVRHLADGKEETIECGLVAWRVPLDPKRKLAAITLPRERTMHVFALSLARTKRKE